MRGPLKRGRNKGASHHSFSYIRKSWRWSTQHDDQDEQQTLTYLTSAKKVDLKHVLQIYHEKKIPLQGDEYVNYLDKDDFTMAIKILNSIP